MTIKNWSARRAGATITINGKDAETEQPVKLVGVEEIAGTENGKPYARTAKGEVHELA